MATGFIFVFAHVDHIDCTTTIYKIPKNFFQCFDAVGLINSGKIGWLTETGNSSSSIE